MSVRFRSRAAAACLVVLLSTGCTYASRDLGTVAGTNGASPGLPTVDLSGVTKDSAAAALVPSDLASKGKWVVASDTTYAPAEFLSPADGQTPVGFDVDLITAIGHRLGLHTEVRTAPFDAILGGIGARYDASISSFIINPKRLTAVDMVSYMQGGSALAVRAGNPDGLAIDALCGHDIGVQTGSVQETKDLPTLDAACTSKGKPRIKAAKYATQDEVTTALIGGKLEGMLEGTIAMGYATVQTNHAIEMVGEPYSRDTEGIVLPKGTQLTPAVQKALQSLIDDGTYARIMEAWGQKAAMVTKAQANPTNP